LLDAGVNLESEDKRGYTALMIAALTGGSESLKVLINKGANPNHLNIYNATPLIESARYGSVDTIRILIEECKRNNIELDINHRDKSGITALEYSVARNKIEVINIYKNNNLLTEEDLKNIAIIAVENNCKFSFDCIINIILERHIFTSDTAFTINLVDKLFNHFMIDMFISLYDICETIINLIFEGNINLYIKSLIIIHKIKNKELQIINVSTNTNIQPNINNNNNNINNEKVVNKTENNIESNKEIITNNIDNDNNDNKDDSIDEMNENDNDNINKEENNNNNNTDGTNYNVDTYEKIIKYFIEICENLYNSYIKKLKNHNNQEVSTALLKCIIYFDSEEKFNELIKISKENGIKNDNIIYNKQDFQYFEFKRKRKLSKDINDQWESLKILKNHNILTLSIINIKDIYFYEILTFNSVKHLIFQKLLDLGNKNILHILFTSHRMERFKHIIEIISSEYKNEVEKFIEMIDEADEDLLTPLDLLIKHKFYEQVEIYTELINGN
jgi:hypothetical protein